MHISKRILRLGSSLLVLCVVWGAGQDPDLSFYGTEEEVRYDVKINTCCALDLSLGNSTCQNSNSNGGRSEEWTFPQHLMAENVTSTFPLRVQGIHCRSGPAKLVNLPMLPRGGNTSEKLLKNGYIKVGREYYPPAEYCINGINENDLEVLVCPQACDGTRPCIKKCCGLDKVYSFGLDRSIGKGCLPQKGDYWKPTFYDDYTTKSTHDILDPHFIEHYPSEFKTNCTDNKIVFFLYPEQSGHFNNFFGSKFNSLVYRVREDGKVIFKHSRDGRCSVLETEHFCLDGPINYGRPNDTFTYVNLDDEIVLYQCPLPSQGNSSVKKAFGLLYGVTMIASSIFLLLTIATYIALWDRQSVHGWTIVSHTVSLFFMYIFLGIAHIIGVTTAHAYLGSPGCIGIGIVTHYFFLATFCWLFIISVDLWLTFRAFTPRSGTRSKGVSRYVKYSIFGWGVPAIIVIVGIILEDKYPDKDCHNLITPAYGKDSCFPQQRALGVYLYYPIALMIGLNIVFFAITTFKLYLYRESTKMATKDDKQTQFYRLFLKLFFIMGVLWVFEVISWAASGNGYHWYWIVFDMLNVLRALAVFIIFVCKRDIIFSLEEKYPCLKPVLLPFAWLFKRKHSPHGRRDHDSSMMTRSSTLRQTITSEGKPESIGLIPSSIKVRD